MLDVWFNRIEAESKFCVSTTVEAGDEWLHSFYYFNDEIPTKAEFEKTIGNYLTFEFSMIMHNRAYLFESPELEKPEFKAIDPLEDKKWHEFFLKDIFEIVQRGKRLTKANQVDGQKPYISSTALNNGVDNFIGNESGVRLFSGCLTIANSGSVGSSFYHPYEFVASDHVTHLKNSTFSSFLYLFVATQTNRLSGKYNFNREINDKRISRDKIMLPVNDKAEPDYKYMEQYMMNLEYKKRKEFIDFAANEKLSELKKANKKIQQTQKAALLI